MSFWLAAACLREERISRSGGGGGALPILNLGQRSGDRMAWRGKASDEPFGIYWVAASWRAGHQFVISDNVDGAPKSGDSSRLLGEAWVGIWMLEEEAVMEVLGLGNP